MTTKAEPHQGLGVAQYSWSTSPLRRAVDLINQRQIISVVQNAEPAYPQKSDALTTHMRNFELTYKAYSEFQIRMERYWCLQYLIQESIHEIHATVWRENLVRLDNLPYMTKVYGMPEMKSGTRVSLQVQDVDTLMMELRTKFLRVLEEEPIQPLLLDDAEGEALDVEAAEPVKTEVAQADTAASEVSNDDQESKVEVA